MNEEVLLRLGLTPAEAKVYLALLAAGQTSAGLIVERSGLQNSTTHKTLHRLISKGFASFVVKGKRKLYAAADPKQLLAFLEENKKKFEMAMPELLALKKPVEKQEAVVYEGFRGLKTMLYEFIKDGKEGDEYLFFAFYTENPNDFNNVYDFYREFEIERRKRGLIVRGISPANIRDKFKGRNTKTVVFVDLPVPMNISIFKDAVIFTPWEDGQVSYLINSRQMAESFRKYFYTIWNNYNKG